MRPAVLVIQAALLPPPHGAWNRKAQGLVRLWGSVRMVMLPVERMPGVATGSPCLFLGRERPEPLGTWTHCVHNLLISPLASSSPNLFLLSCSSSQQMARHLPRRRAQPGPYPDNFSLSYTQIHQSWPSSSADTFISCSMPQTPLIFQTNLFHEPSSRSPGFWSHHHPASP